MTLLIIVLPLITRRWIEFSRNFTLFDNGNNVITPHIPRSIEMDNFARRISQLIVARAVRMKRMKLVMAGHKIMIAHRILILCGEQT